MLSRDDLNTFKKITGVDIDLYLQQVIVFFAGSYNRIVSYYSGEVIQAGRADFIAFEKLINSTDNIFTTFQLRKNNLKNLKWWLLLEHLEEIDLRLKTLRKINKWSKSSITDFGYNPSIQVNYTLKAKQTLERVSQDILKQDNPNDQWFDIAVNNQLIEEDYTPSGGVDVKLSFPRINRGINIDSVVDVMIGKSIYGKDFDKKIQFDSTEDLKCLSYDETVQQDVEILANLRKNDNPDFPTLGLQSTVVVGSNRAQLNFPIIIRQMNETFASDDSLVNFQIDSIELNQDVLQISFKVQTRLNETIDGEIQI